MIIGCFHENPREIEEARERKKKINVNLLCFFQLQKICKTEETERPSNMFCSFELYKENRATPSFHLN
jgi:hypothetical protein